MSVLGQYAAKIIQRAWLKLPFVGADGYNISELIQLRAAMDTADYCIVHLPRARAFGSSLDLLTFAVSRVSIEGSYLEFGVASGKTINHVAKQISRTVHGFDSFEGLPEDWHTGFEKGAFAQKSPSVRPNVQLHVGWFDKTLPAFLAGNAEPVAFLHVDCDLYSSTREIFRNLGPRILPGTVIVFDEYFNHPTWREDEHKAFHEFIAERRIGFDYVGYVPSHQQVCVVMKELEPMSTG